MRDITPPLGLLLVCENCHHDNIQTDLPTTVCSLEQNAGTRHQDLGNDAKYFARTGHTRRIELLLHKNKLTCGESNTNSMFCRAVI